MKLGRGHIGGYLESWRREIGSRYFIIIVYKILNIEKVIIKIHSKKKKNINGGTAAGILWCCNNSCVNCLLQDLVYTH